MNLNMKLEKLSTNSYDLCIGVGWLTKEFDFDADPDYDPDPGISDGIFAEWGLCFQLHK